LALLRSATAKVGAAEVGAAEVGAEEVGVAKVGAAEVGAAEVGAAEVGAAEVGAAEVGAAEVGAAEVGAAEKFAHALVKGAQLQTIAVMNHAEQALIVMTVPYLVDRRDRNGFVLLRHPQTEHSDEFPAAKSAHSTP
jgi:hypothetical protein